MKNYLIAVGIIAVFAVSFAGYKAYQNHVGFQAFMSGVESAEDNGTNPFEQAEAHPQRIATGASARSAPHQIDVSVPPIQVSFISKEDEALVEPVDWSQIPPEL